MRLRRLPTSGMSMKTMKDLAVLSLGPLEPYDSPLVASPCKALPVTFLVPLDMTIGDVSDIIHGLTYDGPQDGSPLNMNAEAGK